MPPLSDPLPLSQQLDAMLLGWLERHADRCGPSRPGRRAKAIVTVAANSIAEVEAFCAQWGLTLKPSPLSGARWTVLLVEGPALPVRGFTQISSMYRL